MSAPNHSTYPHESGRLYDCPACESECFCAPNTAMCVGCALTRESDPNVPDEMFDSPCTGCECCR